MGGGGGGGGGGCGELCGRACCGGGWGIFGERGEPVEGLGGCVSCADFPCVQLEREGFACGPWSAFAGAGGEAAGVQEREVFAQADFCGFAEACGRWERLGGAFVRIFVVRRGLKFHGLTSARCIRSHTEV